MTASWRRRARAKASTDAASAGSSSAPASSCSTQPGQHLAGDRDVARRSVLGRRARLVERASACAASRGRARRAAPRRRHRGRPPPYGRQRAAARDPHRLEAALEQHPLGADPDRERQPGELAEARRCRRPAASSSRADRLGRGALQPDARAAASRSTTSAAASRRGAWRRGRTSPARRPRAPGVPSESSRRVVPDVAERRAVDGREHERLAATAGPRTRAPAPAARRCPTRCRRRRARGTRRARRSPRAGAARSPPGAPTTFTSERPACSKRSTSTAKPRLSEALGDVGRHGAVARAARPPVGHALGEVDRASDAPDARRRARPRPIPAATAAGGCPARTSSARSPRSRERTPPGRSVARSSAPQPTIPHGGSHCAPHPAGGRRALRPEAADLSAAQGGLRRRRARWTAGRRSSGCARTTSTSSCST